MRYNNKFKTSKDLLVLRLEEGIKKIQDQRDGKVVKNDFGSSKAGDLDDDVGAYKPPDPDSFKKGPEVKNGSMNVDVLMKALNKEFNNAEHHYGKKEFVDAKKDYLKAKTLCEKIQAQKKDHFLAKMMLKKTNERLADIDQKTDLDSLLEKDQEKNQ